MTEPIDMGFLSLPAELQDALARQAAKPVGKFQLYLAEVRKQMCENPEWRWGQTGFNVLRRLYPDLAENIAQTDLDPFFIDDRMPTFLKWLNRQL